MLSLLPLLIAENLIKVISVLCEDLPKDNQLELTQYTETDFC